jgi:hypothetical protein
MTRERLTSRGRVRHAKFGLSLVTSFLASCSSVVRSLISGVGCKSQRASQLTASKVVGSLHEQPALVNQQAESRDEPLRFARWHDWYRRPVISVPLPTDRTTTLIQQEVEVNPAIGTSAVSK